MNRSEQHEQVLMDHKINLIDSCEYLIREIGVSTNYKQFG